MTTNDTLAPGRDPCGPTRGGRLHAESTSWDDACSCEPEPRWQALETPGRSTVGADAGPRENA